MVSEVEKELARLAALERAATRGPWEHDGDPKSWDDGEYGSEWVRLPNGKYIVMPHPLSGSEYCQTIDDAKLVAAMRTALAPLIAEVRLWRDMATGDDCHEDCGCPFGKLLRPERKLGEP